MRALATAAVIVLAGIAVEAQALELTERKEPDQTIDLPAAAYGDRVLLDAGDINSDGYADVLAKSTAHSMILHGSAKGLVQSQLLGTHSGLPAAGGDLNGDGYDDVVLHIETGEPQAFPGGRDGVDLDSPWSLDHGGGPPGELAVIPGDLNGDGYDDLVTTGSEGVLWVYLGSAKGPVWAAEVTSDEDPPDTLLAAGDVNSDGRDDVLVVVEPMARLFSGTDEGLSDSRTTTNLNTGDTNVGEFAVTCGADTDGDGTPELVAAEHDLTRAHRFRSTGLRYGLSDTVYGSATAFGTSVAMGDLDTDGYAELVVGAIGPTGGKGQVQVFRGGTGELGSHGVAVLPGGPGSRLGYELAVAGDVNGDGYRDLVATTGDDELWLWFGGSWLGGAR